MGERTEVEVGGQALSLGWAREVWWAGERTVLVADVHLGKAAAYRRAGVPVPESTTARDLERLTGAVAAHSADRLIVLGDLVHSSAWADGVTGRAVRAWRASLRSVEVVCVEGNHDRAAGGVGEALGVEMVSEGTVLGGLTLAHEPERLGEAAGVCGHLHPGVRVRGGAGDGGVSAPCYWLRGAGLVMPAFGSFTGTGAVRARAGDRVWAVGAGSVVEVPVVVASRVTGTRR